jgi:Heterokaryon incompatibility protein (HET)
VQDDTSDWETESAAMASIYGNCVLTVAATAAKNSEEGLFAEVLPVGCKPLMQQSVPGLRSQRARPQLPPRC